MTSASGVVLDAGPFIALEKHDKTMVALAQRFADSGTPLVTSAGVVAQIWRGGGHRQVPVAFLLRRVKVVDITESAARLIGLVLGRTERSDLVDVHVVLLARERDWPILSSDPRDLRAIDPGVHVERI